MKDMKHKILPTIVIALAMTVKISAAENTAATPFLSILTASDSAGLPSKASELVAGADVKNLKQTTINVVKAAVGLNPAAAPAIVGSISQSSSAMAGTAAATAVALVPNQMTAIVRAASMAAPSKAGSIVEAVCRVMPTAYQKIAVAVAEAVPGANEEILAAIATAIPELKNAIDQTLVSYDGKIPSLSIVLAQVAQVENSPSTTALSGTSLDLPRGPSVSPANLPISSTPVVKNPSSGGQVPTGGRAYPTP